MTEKRVWITAFLLGTALILGRFTVTGSVFGGDAVYYFMQMRSLVLDQDLDFRNEYAHFHEEKSGWTGNSKIPELPPENPQTGRLPNKYPIGLPLLLTPFFALAHGISLLFSRLGASVATDGYGALYQLAGAFGSLGYGLFGIKLWARLGERWFPAKLSLQSAFTLLLATPLLYYMTMEPLMSHTLSMAAVTALLWFWLRSRESTRDSDWLGLGALAGICALIRYQDGLFAVLPALDLLVQAIKRERKTASALRGLFFLTLGFAILFSLQLCTNQFLCGSFFETGYAAEGFPYWRSPKLLFTLFSKECGLILWSPILLFALIGLFCFSIKHPRPGIFLVTGFLLQWFLVSSWSTPNQGDSFGNRMLLNASAVYFLGLLQMAFKAQQASPKFSSWTTKASGFFIALNAILCLLYCFRVIGHPY